ncbi:protein CLP1 homolog [Salvia splendens]|uniref:protein CLP1 homolog n=1 Tax=Salvia splendens TaxID=180675 RepID=UPI001C27CA8F|nr:protein CLP1 homolog [Salvia splendens]
MAYGGCAVAPTAPPGSSETVRHVKLDKECELRIEVGPDFPLRLRLVSGTAEIFGTEIRLSFPPGHKFAVFTWYGATIEIDGSTETDYTADELYQCACCVMRIGAKLHNQFSSVTNILFGD